MLNRDLKSKIRWLSLASLLILGAAAVPGTAQDSGVQAGQAWPKEIASGDSKIIVYAPQLESFRGNLMSSRAAVSRVRADGSDPVFGGIWWEATLKTDVERRIAEPIEIRVTDFRLPQTGADEMARLRRDLGEQIPGWRLQYSIDALLADLKLVEERKAAAQEIKAEVPDILFRNGPAVLLPIDGEPAWRASADASFRRLENSATFVLQDSGTGICYLHIPPFWWSARNPLGPWTTAAEVPDAAERLWQNEPKPQAPAAAAEAPQRPELIPVSRPTELVWTDGPAEYAAIAGTNLIYIKNTESDVFIDIDTQHMYALFSGRWYRRPAGKTAWDFVASDQLPPDFSRIPLSSEKQHVLACVAGTAAAREAVKYAEIPQTEAVKPGPAVDLSPTFDGDPQFTDIPGTPVQYVVNTPYSIFCADRRYYWCLDAIWYVSAFVVGPWYVCDEVCPWIYRIPPSCPHYYVTYCHVFGVTPYAITFGYYPGYRGCYVWGRTVVYGTGWQYRPWCGTRCYSRPVTWGVGVRYSPASCSWSIPWGMHRPSGAPAPRVQAGAGGWWGGAQSSPTVRVERPNLNPRENLYVHQPERLAPSPARPTQRVQPSRPEPEAPRSRGNPAAPRSRIPEDAADGPRTPGEFQGFGPAGDAESRSSPDSGPARGPRAGADSAPAAAPRGPAGAGPGAAARGAPDSSSAASAVARAAGGPEDSAAASPAGSPEGSAPVVGSPPRGHLEFP